MEDSVILEIPVASRVQKIEMPLSDVARVFIILDGTLEKSDFKRLHAVVDLICESCFPSATTAAPIAAEQTVVPHRSKFLNSSGRAAAHAAKPCGKHPDALRDATTGRCLDCMRRVLHPLPPCAKHPNSLRSDTTNRCLACDTEHRQDMRARYAAKLATKTA